MKSRIVFFSFLIVFFLNGFSQVVVTNGLAHDFTASQGSVLKGEIILYNSEKSIENIRVYQSDYAFYADGTSIYPEPGTLERSNALWIDFSPAYATILPETGFTINYTVHVPSTKDASLTGTYWSVIMVEPVVNKNETVSENSANIVTIVRYAIQIVVNIDDTGEKKIQILNGQFVKKNDGYVLELDIENVGERGLRPTLKVELYDSTGNFIRDFIGDCFRLYPETSARFKADLGALSKGDYFLLALIDNDDIVWGSRYTVSVK